MDYRIIADFGTSQITYTPNATRAGKFGVVNLDYDQVWQLETGGTLTHKSRPSKNNAPLTTLGLPATARFIVAGNDEYVLLHKDLQLWMHSLSWARVPSMSEADAKNEWRGLMWDGRMITDYAGSSTHADYVNGTHLDREAMKLKPMVTGGSIVKIIGERRVKGVDCYVVEAINPIGNYRQYNPAVHWWLFFYPTISRREGVRARDRADVENISIPFPQYRDRVILPVFAMAGSNENYIPKERVRVLRDNEALPNPYVPVRDNPYK